MNTPLDLYMQMRECMGKQTLPTHPFYAMYQPLAALRALEDLRWAKNHAPLQMSSGRAPLWCGGDALQGALSPIALSCQLAILWAMLAEKWKDENLSRAAADLAGFIAPIISEGLTTLWTSERDYEPVESDWSSKIFLSAIGRPCGTFDSNAVPWVFQQKIQLTPSLDKTSDPSVGYELLRAESVALALSGSGYQTSAGAARVGALEIPAFGPHLAPLSQAELFGIGPGESGWFCAHADKEVWFSVRGKVSNGAINILLDSRGVQPEKPIAFAFYIKADQSSIQGKVFKAKSIARYSGDSQPVEFSAKDAKISFTVSQGLKMELIPLAGDRAFWGASFLLAIWLPSLHETISFNFIKTS